jgi:outer membrane receptor protein involved in Fe transport
VDGDGKVSLRGNQNVAIQINGRPAPLTGDALTNFIKQLPAGMVDRVEVVPNPSAKYDPDGMGGIVNLVLKQYTDLGTSGGLTVGAGTGGKYNASGNLGSQRGPLTLFGSYGFNRDARDTRGSIFRDQHFSGVPQVFTEQQSRGDFVNQSHTVNANADLKLGARNLLSSTFMLNSRAGDMASGNGVTLFDEQRQVTSSYDLLSDGRQRGLTTDYTLAFRRTLQPQRNELSAQAHFNRSRDHGVTLLSTDVSNGDPAVLADSRNDLVSVTRQADWQADYTRQLSAATRLEAGYKGTLRWLDNGQTVDSLYSDGSAPSSFQNDFTYDENVQAGYGLLTQQLGSSFSLQGGLRLERASTTFRLSDAEAYPNDYTSLFPSAAATLELGQSDRLRFSYSKRIQRPNPFQLNPFPFMQDQYNRFMGNPELKPEYTHSYEASLTHSTSLGSITVTPFYRHTTDAVRRYQSLGTDGVNTMTFRNLATANSYGTDANVQLRLGRLSGFVGASAFRLVTDGNNVASGLAADAFSWSARLSLNFKLSPSTDLQWFQMYRAGSRTEQGRVGAMQMANLAVRQKLNDRSSLSVRVSDPLNTMRFTSTTDQEFYSEESQRRFNARAVYLSFSYSFGRPPRLRQPVPQPDNQQAPTQDPTVPGGR